MWLYLEVAFYKGELVKMRLLEWALFHYDQHPYKKRKWRHRHPQREDDVKTKREDGHLQAKENGSFPQSPQKGPFLLTLWSGTSSLHNCKEINVCCLNHPVWDIYTGDLSCNSGLRDTLKSNKHGEIILRVKNVVIPRMRVEMVWRTIVSNMEDDMHDNMSLSAMAPTTK